MNDRSGSTRRTILGTFAASVGAVASSGIPSLAAAAVAPDEMRIASQLDDHISRAIRDADFSGAVMLTRNGRTVFTRATGLASRDYATANSVDTRFNLASINKMFTATAILRLVEQRRMRLDAPIATYLPAYPDADIAGRVTIEQLLSHSSGLGNYWEAIADRAPSNYLNHADFIPLFKGKPLEFEPGSRFAYSNVGYVVLGLIIEAVTGTDYFTHVRQTIFGPLGMMATESWPLDLVVPNRATGFTRDESTPGAWRNNMFINAFRGNAAGGGNSTVGDLTRFAQAFAADKLFTPATRKGATRGRFPYAKGRYGLGFSEEVINGHRVVGHTGGHIGIANEVMVFEDLGWTLAVLTNGDVDGYWSVSAFAKDLLCGKSQSTQDYWHSMALVAAASDRNLAAARALHAKRSPGVKARSSVLEVESVKARHRGRPEVAARIDALAKDYASD